MVYFDHSEETPSILSVMETIEGQDFNLDLSSRDLAFLSGVEVYTRMDMSVRLSEGDLHNLYSTLDKAMEGNPDTAESRANTTIRKMIDQRLICRVSSGIDSDSIYRLTFLGEAIASDMIRKDSLTKETLETMLSAVAATLDDITKSSNADGDRKYWRLHVEVPLKATVSLLIEAIDRRQHSLDQKQTDAQNTFEKLYSEDDSIEGLGRCEELLNTVANTLKELDHALFQGAGVLKEKLSTIEENAESFGQTKSAEISRMIYQSLDDIVDWARIRGEKWSEYYHSAHEFLRSAVRLDVGRAFANRLRKNISTYFDNPWVLNYTIADKYTFMREENYGVESEAISRESSDIVLEGIADTKATKVIVNKFKESINEKLKNGDHVDLAQILNDVAGKDDNLLFHLAVTGIRSMVNDTDIQNLSYHPEWQALTNGAEVQGLTVVKRIKSKPQENVKTTENQI
jgi:chromosome condensin MukBEF complex kleisin-like MukF subunit